MMERRNARLSHLIRSYRRHPLRPGLIFHLVSEPLLSRQDLHLHCCSRHCSTVVLRATLPRCRRRHHCPCSSPRTHPHHPRSAAAFGAVWMSQLLILIKSSHDGCKHTRTHGLAIRKAIQSSEQCVRACATWEEGPSLPLCFLFLLPGRPSSNCLFLSHALRHMWLKFIMASVYQ